MLKSVFRRGCPWAVNQVSAKFKSRKGKSKTCWKDEVRTARKNTLLVSFILPLNKYLLVTWHRAVIIELFTVRLCFHCFVNCFTNFLSILFWSFSFITANYILFLLFDFSPNLPTYYDPYKLIISIFNANSAIVHPLQLKKINE